MEERKYYVLCESNCKFESMTKEQILTAIQQAVSTGGIKDVDTGFITTIKEQNSGNALTFWVGTTAQYNAITEKAEDCFYILTDDTKYTDMATAISELSEEIENVAKLANNQPPYIVTFSGNVSPTAADKTFAEIYEAAKTGRTVIGQHKYSTGYEYYQLTRYTESVLSFAHTKEYKFDTKNKTMSDQLETKLVRFMSDGTFKTKTIYLPQKEYMEEFYVSEELSISSPYDEIFEIIESESYIKKYGNKVFLNIKIEAKGDGRKIGAAGTKSDLRSITIPEIHVNNIIMPLEGVGVLQGFVYYTDVDQSDASTTTCEAIPVIWSYVGENGADIFCDLNHIHSKSAVEVDHFRFSCMWITEE